MLGKLVVSAGAVMGLCVVGVAPAQADSIVLKFTRVTGTFDAGDGAPDISSQLSVLVADTDKDGNAFDGNLVRFTFHNDVEIFSEINLGITASVSQVHFDDGTLLNVAELINDENFTDFEQNFEPGNLPGGGNVDPPFQTTHAFDADPQNFPSSGLDQGSELLHIYFNLSGDQTFSDLLNALYLGGQEGGLRLGLFVENIGGDSEARDSYVNIAPVVPSPGAAAGGLALLGLVVCARRRAV